MLVKQSVSLPMFKKVRPDMEALLPTLAEIGFQGVEIWHRDENFAHLSRSAQREGMSICAMIGSGVPLNSPDHHADAEREIRESIGIASDHGIANLICFSGNRREDLSDAQGIAAIAEGFSRVASDAEEKGVTLLLELLNSKVDHPGYQADDTRFGVEVCRRVNSPRVRLLYDIYHMQIMEGDVIRTLRENISWIAHLHTAGNPGRNDLDDQQELNYAAISRAVADSGYRGFVGHEFVPKSDVIMALRQAYSLWRH